LLPSEKESFGLSALEAMACEVPVISSNAGGIPEVNIHGVTGFLSEIGDIDDMVKNSLYILKDENLTTFKANALIQAKTFEVSLIMPLYVEIYNKVVNDMKNRG
jgi:glycosyltransferase involved in cell wall biosynthesis